MSDWVLRFDGFDPANERLREALCVLGNGYFATRGAVPECRETPGVHYPGTYVAGCYNRLTSHVAGQTVENESLVNVPNWLSLTFRIGEGEWFDPGVVELLDYQQELDMRRGVLTRRTRFRDGHGRETRLVQRRFVHMSEAHVAGLETTLVAENWSGRVEFISALDGRVTNSGVERYRELNSQHLQPLATAGNAETIALAVETAQSHIRVAEAARTLVSINDRPVVVERSFREEPGYIGQRFAVDLGEGAAVTVEKIAVLYTSRDWAISESLPDARNAVQRVPAFDELLESHVLALDHLWRRYDLLIEDDDRTALILRLHVFHLLQTVSENSIELDAGVPPRGLHGEAYRGLIMWDELFVFPFLNLRLPEVSRALLLYRWRRLPEARRAARQAGYAGAMYPWQSGSNGREESQRLHLNPRSGRWVPDYSWHQRHINAAVAYNVWQYYEVSGDIEFMAFYGAEMLVEIARFWASAAQYNRTLDRYEIHHIMGPDEYHDAYPWSTEPGLSNNAYTNVTAVWVLLRTLDALQLLQAEQRGALYDKLGLKREETERWEDISRKMRIVFHDNGIISQFEGYGRLEEFDWESYRQRYGDIHRLDRLLEAEGDTTNRYKVSKQADVLMLFYLFSADELRDLFGRLGYPFEYETIPKNVEYYTSRTAHGSTLSRIVDSWVLARSHRERSWQFFKDALESDVSDIQGGTTPEGIHLGAMAGTIDLLQVCYTGLETRGDILYLNPVLPSGLAGLSFSIQYRRNRINLKFSQDKLAVSAETSNAPPVLIGFKEEVIELQPGNKREFRFEGNSQGPIPSHSGGLRGPDHNEDTGDGHQGAAPAEKTSEPSRGKGEGT